MLGWSTLLFAVSVWISGIYFARHFRERITAWILSHRGSESSQLDATLWRIKDVIGCYESGWIPSPSLMLKLEETRPYGAMIAELIDQLRTHGAAVLPTLQRFSALVQRQSVQLKDSIARSSQAMLQANVGLVGMILQSYILYKWMPGVQSSPWIWTCVCVSAWMSAWMGRVWIRSIALRARRGGFSTHERELWIVFLGAYERWAGLLHCGIATDRAWTNTHAWMCTVLGSHPKAILFLESWGSDLWASTKIGNDMLSQFPGRIRQAIRLSHQEGRPSADRAHTAMDGIQQDMQLRIESYLQKLPTRSLLPLGLCMAPACLMQLGMAMVLSFLEGGSNGIF